MLSTTSYFSLLKSYTKKSGDSYKEKMSVKITDMAIKSSTTLLSILVSTMSFAKADRKIMFM